MTSRTDFRAVYTRMKTRVPAPSTELIARPRLLEALDVAAQAKLIVLQAPAGYGKTSLLQQWGAQLVAEGAKVAWFTPDEGDRDAAVFLAYLVHALEQAGHTISEQVRTVVTAESFYSWKVVATQLANQFVGMTSSCYLFIDDVQHLRDCEALACLRHLIESTPPELHFVLASREDSGIPLGRLRALGRVFELRTADLRFESTETLSYFATRGHTQLTSEQLGALESRAEGWIVGLKLLSMAMQWKRAEALSSIIATGEHAEVADFFAEDVLARQPHDIQEFLLRTCVLERLCPALCDSLPGVQASRALIDRCDAAGLFLVALDQTRTWYRYHSLFADFLRRQLNDRFPGVANELRVAASHWLEQAGFPAEAFDYALKGNNPIRAAEILDAQCDGMWSAGRQQVIQSLAERLPPHVQALYPRIMLAMAWRLVAQWKIDQAQHLVAVSRARLAELERGGHDGNATRNLRHRVLHRESQIAQHLYQLDVVEKLSRQLIEENAGGEDDSYLKASVLLTLQYAQREQFQLENVHRLIEQAREAVERTGFSHGMIFLCALAGPSYLLVGRVQEAIRLLTQGLGIARDLTGSGSPLGSIVALHLAQALYECNDVEACAQLLDEYSGGDPPVGMPDQLIAGWITRSRVARLRGDFGGALEILHEASEFAERYSVQRLRLVAAAEQVRVLLRMGRPDDAGRYARRVGLARTLEQPAARGRLTTADSAQALAWCRLAASQGKLSEALAVARRWRAHVTTAEAAHSAVEWGITVAELLVLSGDRKAAQRSLWQAVAQAAPARFIRAFLDEGEPIALLLEQMARGEPKPEDSSDTFLRELVAIIGELRGSHVVKAAVEPAQSTEIIGRLSTRELEILVLAGSGMLNKRISEKLGLTEGTVKWYLQQVFDKLGVRDRARAASKARQLGLIS
jgi:LuxR family maltose regulon positive regulatory protein